MTERNIIYTPRFVRSEVLDIAEGYYEGDDAKVGDELISLYRMPSECRGPMALEYLRFLCNEARFVNGDRDGYFEGDWVRKLRDLSRQFLQTYGDIILSEATMYLVTAYAATIHLLSYRHLPEKYGLKYAEQLDFDFFVEHYDELMVPKRKAHTVRKNPVLNEFYD